MFITRAVPDQVNTNRLDADFYRPEYLVIDQKLASLDTASLGTCGKFFAGPFGSKLPSNLYLNEGIPLFRVGNVGQFEVLTDNFAHLAPTVHQELLSSEVVPGDILIVKASVGEKIAKIPDWLPKANITQHIIGIRPNGTFDSDFICAFLYSKYGRSQLERFALGSIIQYLGIHDARSVTAYKPSAYVQKYIGDKVRQAERLRAWAKELQLKISETFSFLTQNLLEKRNIWRASADDLSPYRINPKQYDPVVLDMLEKAQTLGCQLVPLQEMLGDKGIAGGATPKGATYFDEGVLFARVQNVKPLALDLSDAVFIDSETDDELMRSRCEKDDIVLTITGYPGTASLVTEQDLPVNINQHSVRLRLEDEYPAGYVCAAINSDFVGLQVDRAAIGGTRDALDYPSVKNLLIPVLCKEDVEQIDQDVRSIIAANQLSKALIASAKSVVELLIEGQFTEQQLINAQKALETDDTSLDREILTRLTTKGLDGDGDPLFTDLDQLYELLAQSQSLDE
jgi:type I restriction enzyme S subunit